MPPNWDSWSKIRVLRDGFDVEEVSNGWSIDLNQDFPETPVNGTAPAINGVKSQSSTRKGIHDPPGSTVAKYEEEIRDPSFDSQLLASQADNAAKFEPTTNTQEFLTEQQRVLERLKQKAEAEGDGSRRSKDDVSAGSMLKDNEITGKIGPVRINMGGIQADADDMLQRLKVRIICFSFSVIQVE